ncbi:glycerophosphodiester phosphodiesterase family protein [Mucilaginibacter pedocola]|uniref:Glycerophosphodiester phosphodiesterase n=1 Tax=Mucilaginibacter pedocola TaxID=1792845 RepID=A0A1S9P887_9SPHI|nr:glycerophosphodiester phosphodiesterase family protein [Mucilaginibacter pedocola]OOQ57166.1 glycerophosphodiester phosphodiesterase [Mucilaginibacter pedocola]
MRTKLFISAVAGLVALSGFGLFNAEVPYPKFSTEAHRGGRGIMPENTIPAMKNAIDMGVTTLEMDTHITGDGQVVLSHDEYINPLFSLTADSKEISPDDAKKLILYKMPYTELKRYDVGSKPCSNFPQQKKLKAYMPLLSDLIDSVQTYSKVRHKPQVFYNIETKCSAEGDGLYNPAPDEFVSLLMAVIEKKKITPWVVIQSFDKRTIQIINKKYPKVRTSYLVMEKHTADEYVAELGFTPFIISPYCKIVDAAFVKSCHDKNIKVLPWTANSAEEISRLKSVGVDGIISDYPGLLVGE